MAYILKKILTQINGSRKGGKTMNFNTVQAKLEKYMVPVAEKIQKIRLSAH